VKASAHKQEFTAVNQVEFHVNLMTLHAPIQDELILGGALERKFRGPVLVATLAENQSLCANLRQVFLIRANSRQGFCSSPRLCAPWQVF